MRLSITLWQENIKPLSMTVEQQGKNAHIIRPRWFPTLERFASVVHSTKIPKLAVVIVRARHDPRARRVKSESRDDLRVILQD